MTYPPPARTLPLDYAARASQARGGRTAAQLRAEVYATESHCWLCRRWVDQSLPVNHRWSRTVDHVIPLAEGGDPLDRNNCRLAHRRCNSARKAGLFVNPDLREQVNVQVSDV